MKKEYCRICNKEREFKGNKCARCGFIKSRDKESGAFIYRKELK